MRILITILLSIGLYLQVLACSFVPYPFCFYVLNQEPDYEIFIGEIVEVIPNGVQFEIKETLRGQNNDGIITIWDNEPIDCNGLFGQSVGLVASVGEEIIISTEVIDSLHNPWEQPGDYRTPLIWFAESVLKIRADSVFGFISGTAWYDDTYIFSMHLEDFKEEIINDNECPSFFVSTTDNVVNPNLRIFPNPTSSFSIIEFDDNLFNIEEYLVRIYSSSGILKREQKLTRKIDFSNYPSGIYYIIIFDPNGVLIERKRLVVIE